MVTLDSVLKIIMPCYRTVILNLFCGKFGRDSSWAKIDKKALSTQSSIKISFCPQTLVTCKKKRSSVGISFRFFYFCFQTLMISKKKSLHLEWLSDFSIFVSKSCCSLNNHTMFQIISKFLDLSATQ